jgi:uncharacterized protein involved in exopolysaccharide biosynthesis
VYLENKMTDINTAHTDSNRVFDEFSPKKLILQVQSSGVYIISKWKIILLFAIIAGLAGAANSYFKKPTYVAEITFALDEGAAQSAKTDYSQLSEQLGISTVLDAGGVFSSMTNIVELIQSRLLIEKTLRSSVSIDGKSLVYADFFLDSLHYRDKWMKGSPYSRLNFLSEKKDKEEKLFESAIIRNIYETVISQNIKIDKKGKGTTIISVICLSQNELFSKYFLEALIAEVTRYYIEIKTQRAKNNVTFLQNRTDSIRNAFNSALYGRASFADAHVNPIRQITSVSGEKQQTDVQILRTTYIDLVRSLESAKTTLMRETPLIQYIDVPILPLKMNLGGILKNFLIFFFLGGFLTSVFLLLYKIYRYIILN